ncbi:hypothetical protein BJ684DRAFT_4458, partial [Piptocephalis cylindrospora]
LTLSQVRGVKSRMIRVGRALDMEISTLAFAIVYLEKLILSAFIDKANRRVISGVCLILAFKVNEGNEKLLPELMHKEVRAQEFSTYAALHFELYIPRREFLPHISRIYADLG